MNAFRYETACLIAADPRLASLSTQSQPVRLKHRIRLSRIAHPAWGSFLLTTGLADSTSASTRKQSLGINRPVGWYVVDSDA